MASQIPREVKKEIMDGWVAEAEWRVALLSPAFSAILTANPYGVYVNYADVEPWELATGGGYTKDATILWGRVGAYTGTSNENQWLNATDVQWTSATFIARFAVVYNYAAPKRIRAIYDFGADKTVTGGTFTIQWSASGLIKIA